MLKLPFLALLLSPLLTFAQSAKPAAAGAEPTAPPSIHEKTAGMKHLAGLIPLDWDARTGKLFLEIGPLETDGRSSDFIYATSIALRHGVERSRPRSRTGRQRDGSSVLNAVDRRYCSFSQISHFARRAAIAHEQLAVMQSFAQSVLWGFTIAAESSDGSVLVDATDFFLHDGHGVADRLTNLKQGAYRVDAVAIRNCARRYEGIPEEH